MKVSVVGLWHLTCVTATCLAKLGHFITAYDEDPDRITNLNKIEPPVSEDITFYK